MIGSVGGCDSAEASIKGLAADALRVCWPVRYAIGMPTPAKPAKHKRAAIRVLGTTNSIECLPLASGVVLSDSDTRIGVGQDNPGGER